MALPGIEMELMVVSQEERELGFVPDWLVELRRMRGAVLYNRGGRPSFRLSDGSFDDPDPADLEAYHIVAHQFGRPIGCARVMPLTDGRPCAISSTVGEELFDAILSQARTTRARTCEASRWIVLPDCRIGLGAQLVAASCAVVRWLRRDGAFVLTGTRRKQDYALIRLGARAFEGLPLIHPGIFNEERRLLYFDVDHPCKRIEKQIDEMTVAMKLNRIPSPAEIVIALTQSAVPEHSNRLYDR